MKVVLLFSCFISKVLCRAQVVLTTSDVSSLNEIQKDDGFSLPKQDSNSHIEHWDANERQSAQMERGDNQVIQVNIPSNIVDKMEDNVMMIPIATIDMTTGIKGNSQNVDFTTLHFNCLLNYLKVTELRNLKCIKLCGEWSRIKFQRHLVQKARSKCKHGGNPKLIYDYANLNHRLKRSLSNSFVSDDSNRLLHSSNEGKEGTNFRKARGRLVAKTLTDGPNAIENKMTDEKTSHSRIQTKNDSAYHGTSSKFDNSRCWQLEHQLGLERSRDPQWAFICVMGLLLVLAISSYCCKLSRINRQHEIHVDFEESFHYVSLKDILKGKKRFLPMFKKKRTKRKYRHLKEVDLANPDSDTSEEELMLYDTSSEKYTGPERKPRA